MAASLLLNGDADTLRSRVRRDGGLGGADDGAAAASWRPRPAPSPRRPPAARLLPRGEALPLRARRGRRGGRRDTRSAAPSSSRSGSPRHTIEALRPHLRVAPAPAELDFSPWGGAYTRVAREATAFAHRDARFLLKHAIVVDPGAPAPGREWLARSWALAHPFGTGGVYPNFPEHGPRRLGRRVPRRQPRAAARGQAPVRPGRRLQLSCAHSTADRSVTPSLRRARSRLRAYGCSSACSPSGLAEHDHDRAAAALRRRPARRSGARPRAPRPPAPRARSAGSRATTPPRSRAGAWASARRRSGRAAGERPSTLSSRSVRSAGPPVGYRSALASRCSPLSS